MTQQEFVKKESEEYRWYENDNPPLEYGLTKGLEIAKAYGNWLELYPFSDIHDDDELLTIFLTEKYGNP